MEGELEMSIAQTIENRFIGAPRHQPGSGSVKPCGHGAHVGTCAAYQRAQLSRWGTQLAQVSRRGGTMIRTLYAAVQQRCWSRDRSRRIDALLEREQAIARADRDRREAMARQLIEIRALPEALEPHW